MRCEHGKVAKVRTLGKNRRRYGVIMMYGGVLCYCGGPYLTLGVDRTGCLDEEV